MEIEIEIEIKIEMEMEIETKIESAHVLFCCCAPWILYCPNRARMYFYMQLSVSCVSARNGQLQIRGARQTNCMCARLPMQKHRRAFHRIDDIRLTGNIWYSFWTHLRLILNPFFRSPEWKMSPLWVHFCPKIPFILKGVILPHMPDDTVFDGQLLCMDTYTRTMMVRSYWIAEKYGFSIFPRENLATPHR